ncbi:MAG: hypothetical protein KDB53_06535 [Planctomycetes bacterium]|nr:hypothetical protein [Planctomycetota bacterium]
MKKHCMPNALFLVLVLGSSLLLTSCLHRREQLVIDPDGGVSATHVWRGEPDDLDFGAVRAPSEATGFDVRRQDGVDDHGHAEVVLEAQAQYPSASEMPRSFARADDRLAAAALQFRTEVEIVEEEGRHLYRFTRIYSPRSWASYTVMEWSAFDHDVLRSLHGGDGAKVLADPRLRRLAVEGLIRYEQAKVTHWAKEALEGLSLSEHRRQDLRMDLERVVAAWFATEVKADRLLRMLENSEEGLAEESARLHDSAREFVLGTMRGWKDIAANEREAYVLAFDESRHAYEVTEDLGDETLEVVVTLPGQVLRHEGGKIVDGNVVWSVSGKDLRDHSVVLRAVSVLEE